MDIFRTFLRHFSDTLLTFPFSGLSIEVPVTTIEKSEAYCWTKWEAYCSTNGRCIAGLPCLQGLETRKVQRQIWGGTAVQLGGVLQYFGQKRTNTERDHVECGFAANPLREVIYSY